MKTLLTLLTVGATSLALMSCGGEEVLSSASGKVSAAQFALIKSEIFDAFDDMEVPSSGTDIPGPNLGGAGPSAMISRLHGIYDGCTKITGEDIDFDNDGVDKSRSYKFNCKNIVDTPTVYNLIGTQSYFDKDDSVPLPEGGYRTEYDIDYSYKGSGAEHSSVYSGFYDYEKVGKSYIYKSQTKYRNIAKESPGVDFEVESNWDFRNTPSGPNNGTLAIDGFLGVKGYNNNGVNPWEVAVAFKVQSKGLTYAACGYNAGAILMTDGSNNKIIIDYSGGCGNPVVTFNGEVIVL